MAEELLKTYTRRIVRAECNPGFEAVHCIADLDQNVEAALPYLNAVLGGFEYLMDPPAVVFKANGKLITVQGNQIAVNALKDEAEAAKILEWMKNEINSAWENRHDITPSFEGLPKPNIMEILKNLPKTNCRQCGFPTCLVFATKTAEGVKTSADCPEIAPPAAETLDAYLARFRFE
ncbi:MAG: (Fe-S)-binding protein [Thermodesulfobacteriota bacterium]|nr:(Fe-S)-binding protein [Thermodesulfobacteriota bacterium]